jgi:hypothetical protein
MISDKELPAAKPERTSSEMQNLLFPRTREASKEKRFTEEMSSTAWKQHTDGYTPQ